MSDKPNYDFPRTDFAVATRETSGWTALTIGVIVAIALTIMSLGVYYTSVIRPQQLAGERKADVESVQNLAGQRAAIAGFIQDYNDNQATVTRLQGQPQSANRDQQVTNAVALMRSDIQNAHSAADNLPNVNVLPADQQKFLTDHPR